jgi:hypothetical protein
MWRVGWVGGDARQLRGETLTGPLGASPAPTERGVAAEEIEQLACDACL